jgi:hypothetical protein
MDKETGASVLVFYTLVGSQIMGSDKLWVLVGKRSTAISRVYLDQ